MSDFASLLCTVRNCGSVLAREGSRLVCAQHHSFDVARSGYINLLQPQDRRSSHPGDTPAAVAARRSLHDRGLTQPLLEAIATAIAANEQDTVLDIGAGDGFYLGSLAAHTNFQGHGIDISIPAIDSAARRYPGCQWIVANADRFIPYADQSFSIVLSITARMNPDESHRVLKPSGKLLVAIPAADDLIELRGVGRDRVEQTLQTFAAKFQLHRQSRVTATAHLDASSVQDLRHAIYRPMQAEPAAATQVTFSLDLLVFEPRS